MLPRLKRAHLHLCELLSKPLVIKILPSLKIVLKETTIRNSGIDPGEGAASDKCE